MLHVGLTGGIGAGKSTVADELARRGAVVVDADAIAREVVAPGTDGLEAVVAELGPGVLSDDGGLDRAALAHAVFAAPDAAETRRRLEAIVHPRVRQVTAERVAALAPGTVVVHDVPLIVENGLAPEYHLVVVVGASVEERVRRLVAGRGMRADDARARVLAQADDDARRAVADVWVDNEGDRAVTVAQVDRLWQDRLAPYAQNLALARPADRGDADLVDPPAGPGGWSDQAARVLARLRAAGGLRVVGAEHVGSTSVPGLPAKDVIDVQVGVRSLADADAIADDLARAGFPRKEGVWVDTPKPSAPDPAAWSKRLHVNADPGRAVNVHVREVGGPGWWYALAFRAWLRADADARADYLAVKRAALDGAGGYAETKEPWFTQAWPRMSAWVERTGWHPRT